MDTKAHQAASLEAMENAAQPAKAVSAKVEQSPNNGGIRLQREQLLADGKNSGHQQGLGQSNALSGGLDDP